MMKKWLLFLVLSISSASACADSSEITVKFCSVLGELASLSAKLRDFGMNQRETLLKVQSLNTLDDPVLHEKVRRASIIVVDAVFEERAKILIPEQLKKAVIDSCLESF